MRIHTRNKPAWWNYNGRRRYAGRICDLQPGVVHGPIGALHRQTVHESACFIDSVVSGVWVPDEETIGTLRTIVRSSGHHIGRADSRNANNIDIPNGIQSEQAVFVFYVNWKTPVSTRHHADHIPA